MVLLNSILEIKNIKYKIEGPLIQLKGETKVVSEVFLSRGLFKKGIDVGLSLMSYYTSRIVE